MSLVQIQKRKGSILRVKPGETPVVELDLLYRQRVISIDLREDLLLNPKRVTSDWSWEAYIETRL